MATQVQLDPTTEQAVDELVTAGGFASREQVLREAVRLMRAQEGFDEDIDPPGVDDDTRQAVERGIEDIKAGRFRPVADVFANLRRQTPRAV